MKHFTIDPENNITLHVSRKAARETGASVFSTEEQFADAIGPNNQRLIDIWNSLAGVTPVKKFTNRKVATERIFRAIQNLGGSAITEPAPATEAAATPEALPKIDATQPTPAIEAPAPETQPEAATPTAQPEVVATVSAQAADVAPVEANASKKTTRAKRTPTDAQKPKATREGSKTDQAIAMMKRPGGATLPELMATFGWQAHTVRGFVAGALTKKLGLTVASTKPDGGERTYTIAS